MKIHRDNLDLFRAVSITSVIIFHLSQYVALPDLLQKTLKLGGFGVDAFFVLSGWLIGGLFFYEYKINNKKVKLKRFWYRRWLRTLPPYYTALFISYIGVYFFKNQNFDFYYMFFLQNYLEKIPFFLISWSLCIEEHFYLFLPLLLLFLLKTRIVFLGLILMLIITVCWRLSYGIISYPNFGYKLTATHLRLDGLTLGVICAYIYYTRREVWGVVSKVTAILCFLNCIVSIFLYYTGNPFMYSIGLFTIPLFFAFLLCYLVNVRDFQISSNPLIKYLAKSSYSLYLTHAVAINFAYKLNEKYIRNDCVFVLLSLGTILALGFAFYRLVEMPSIRLRNYVAP